jgi:hypothetical protein
VLELAAYDIRDQVLGGVLIEDPLHRLGGIVGDDHDRDARHLQLFKDRPDIGEQADGFGRRFPRNFLEPLKRAGG